MSTSASSADLCSLSTLFSSAVIKELAHYGESRKVSRLSRMAVDSNLVDRSCALEMLFESVFAEIKRREHRTEYVYKAAIVHKLLLGVHSLRTATLLNEFRTGDSKADLVLLNGSSTVYEIKSERDTLSRLEKQLSSYAQVFARVNVIAGENHIRSVIDSVPEWVGILVLNTRFQVSKIREPTEDISRIDPLAIFDSIHIKEAKAILHRVGIEVPDLPNTLISSELRKRFSGLSPAAAHDAMLVQLKRSRSLLSACDFIKNTPPSLKAIAISTSLTRREREQLKDTLSKPISECLGE